jgi:hypothetical protein
VTRLRYLDWLLRVEELITGAITACQPRSWQEDTISYCLLRELVSSLRDIVIIDYGTPFRVLWDAFKVDGPVEEDNGDIAVLVKLLLPRKKKLSGIAFLEAKRYRDASYRSIDWLQLERLSGSITNHKLLLYDSNDIDVRDLSVAGAVPFWPFFGLPMRVTRAVTLPSEHALAYRVKTRALHRLSVPLSTQLCARYLRGWDLDYSPQKILDAQNAVEGGVKYLLVASVSIAEEVPPTPTNTGLALDKYRSVLEHDESNHQERRLEGNLEA